eukprot:4026766-Amphidinium_carterae.1
MVHKLCGEWVFLGGEGGAVRGAPRAGCKLSRVILSQSISFCREQWIGQTLLKAHVVQVIFYLEEEESTF